MIEAVFDSIWANVNLIVASIDASGKSRNTKNYRKFQQNTIFFQSDIWLVFSLFLKRGKMSPFTKLIHCIFFHNSIFLEEKSRSFISLSPLQNNIFEEFI